MSVEVGEVTGEQLLEAARNYDDAVEAGETPVLEVLQEEPPVEESPEKGETSISDDTSSHSEPEEGSTAEDDTDNGDKEAEAEKLEADEEPQKSKWEKNEARKAKAWDSINKTKERQKAREAELDEIERDLKSRKREIEEGELQRDEYGFTAKDYELAADNAREDGRPEEAEEAAVKAKELRNIGKKAEADSKMEAFVKAHEETRQSLMREMPELKDKDSELSVQANGILKKYPDLLYVSNGEGLRHAVQIAKWKMGAESASSKEAEAKELSEKLNKLEKKLSVDGGFSGERPDGGKGFDDLSEKEQEAFLIRAAAAVDDTI